jgi:hypothetical protein
MAGQGACTMISSIKITGDVGKQADEKIFGTKRKLIRGWRKFHSEEIHNLHYSVNIITVTN